MRVEQISWEQNGWDKKKEELELGGNGRLIFCFGHRDLVKSDERLGELKDFYPKAEIILCGTSGEIHPNGEIRDETLSASVLAFEKTEIESHCVNVQRFPSSYDAGVALAKGMHLESLKHVLVFSDGQLVNGDALVRGINETLPEDVGVSGGLAGDGTAFEEALVGLDQIPEAGNIVAIGFYGDAIHIGCGSMGGWDAFGPMRRVTKSTENVVYELDGKSALDLYKTYLGDQAEGLPGTGLLFPVALHQDDKSTLVRTILGVDEEEKSMTFAGELPEGAKVQLMRANFDRLIDGASVAADNTFEELGSQQVDFALLISCVGRRLVLGPRTEEEVEVAKEALGDPKIGGFYSYGEISPVVATARCSQLHNQTMTITTLREE